MIDPIIKNITLYQGYEQVFATLYRPGNYSTANGYTIIFGMKSDLSSATEDMTKVSTSALQLTSTHADGITEIQLKALEEDTVDLTAEVYYYEIWASKTDERVPLFKGWVTLVLAAVKSDDTTTTPTYNNLGVSAIWAFDLTLADDSTTDKLDTPFGFDGTLSLVRSGNKITITSTEDDFDFRTMVAGQAGIQGELIDANNYKIYLDPNRLNDTAIYIEIFKRV